MLTTPATTAEERRAIRDAEKQGRQEAQSLAAIAAAAQKQAELDATPEHLRRPANVWSDLIATLAGREGQPGVDAKLKQYRKNEKVRETQIDAIMADKARAYAVETNPETIKARELLAKLTADATDDEKPALARLQGLIDGGAAQKAYEAAEPIITARLNRIREAMAVEATKKANLDACCQNLDEQLKAAEALLPEPVPSPEPAPEAITE